MLEESNDIRLSIIIPVYNVRTYIKRCIESIVEQPIAGIEILIVDDGSTDGSGVLCDQLACDNNNINVIHKSNGGVSTARNVGLKEARGKYVMFVDPDDYIEKGSLVNILKNIDENMDLIIYRSYIRSVNISKEFPSYVEYLSRYPYRGKDVYLSGKYARCVVWSAIFRLSFIRENNLSFIEGMANGEDAAFMTFFFIKDPLFILQDIHLYNVFERGDSASRYWNFEKISRMCNNITLLDHQRKENDSVLNSTIDFLIYVNVSSIYDNLYRCLPLSSWIKANKLIRQKLGGKKLCTTVIKRNQYKIKLLNSSVLLFGLVKLLLNLIRR